jgi:hypothetical protein
MIEGHRVLKLPKYGGGDIEMEVNWNEDPDASGCKLIRIKDGDSRYTVKRDDLLTIMLVFGDLDTQKSLLPLNVQKVKKVERLLQGSFVAKRPYAKGEKIYWQAPWIDTIPINEEVLSGDPKRLKKQLEESSKDFKKNNPDILV